MNIFREVKSFFSANERLNVSDYIVENTKYSIVGFLALAVIFYAGLFLLLVYGHFLKSLIVAVATILALLIGIIFFAKKVSLDIRRVKDIGLSNWWMIALNLVVIKYFFMLIPGAKSENEFGMKPAKSPFWVKGLASFSWLFMLLLHVLFVTIIYLAKPEWSLIVSLTQDIIYFFNNAFDGSSDEI